MDKDMIKLINKRLKEERKNIKDVFTFDVDKLSTQELSALMIGVSNVLALRLDMHVVMNDPAEMLEKFTRKGMKEEK